MLIIFFYYLLPVISDYETLTSATLKNNKLYAIYHSITGYIKCKVYELKDGPIIDIVNSVKTIKLNLTLNSTGLKFIDIPDNSEDSHNKLWVRTKSPYFFNGKENTTNANWVGYINLDDKSLKTDSSFIDFPPFTNSLISEYTVNTVNNKFGSAIYIVGGNLNSNDVNRYRNTNSFLKYNFTIGKWVDMTYSAVGKLKPFIGYKSVIVDNRYLVVLGGYIREKINELESQSGKGFIEKYNSLYNLTIFDTFANNWEIINIRPDIFDTNIATLKFHSFSAQVYNNKIIVIGMLVGEDNYFSGYNSPYMGILDYNSKTWTWIQVYGEDGSKYNSGIYTDYIFVYNDQLIAYSSN
jgi:hypothetical protein